MSNEIATYKGKNRGRALADLTPVISAGIKGAEKHMGRPSYYPNTAKGLDDFINDTLDFLKWLECVNSDPNRIINTIPTVEMWAEYLGIHRQSIYNYSQRGADWKEVIDYYKGVMLATRKAAAENYEMPASLFMFDCTNNHGYLNTDKFLLISDNTREKPQKEISVDEKARISGLVWDETIGEYVIDG